MGHAAAEGDPHVREMIGRCLTGVLGHAAHLDSYTVIGEGISGAATYRVSFDGQDAVLKITPAGSPAYVRARARREIAFYRHLADRIPLRVPRPIGASEDPERLVLLLDAYHPTPPPAHWQAHEYLEAAGQLGRFHAAFWNRTGALADYPWLQRYEDRNIGADIEHAHAYWRALRHQPRLAQTLGKGRGRRLHRLLDRIHEADSILRALPPTLCHGDCNPGNVLTDAQGGLLWADWQETRLGRGPEDLSFFLQQSAIAGGAVPYDDAIRVYTSRLAIETGEEISPATIRRVIEAAELWSRALHWPAYLAQASSEEVTSMLQRIDELAASLDLTE